MSRENIRNKNGARRRALRKRVLASSDTCAICGQPVNKSLPANDPGAPEVDEDLPVSRGGSPYEYGNCQLVHRRCNQLKSNRSTNWARNAIKGKNVKPTSIPFKTSEW
ncbi:HNH endonuclease signature motif containing protein [Bifidobacterium psychraerophilum]|uniref:HNH endonuclease signature motif containing protein n=1 Tax=Bifidobacterium psychraerophilum TaxID=218140 RepID=UPI0039EADB1A